MTHSAIAVLDIDGTRIDPTTTTPSPGTGRGFGDDELQEAGAIYDTPPKERHNQ